MRLSRRSLLAVPAVACAADRRHGRRKSRAVRHSDDRHSADDRVNP